MNNLQFDKELLTRSLPSGFDVETTLSHFSIITYMVDPKLLRPLVHERFELDCIITPKGEQKALISIVPFWDLDFRLVKFPWIKKSFGQTNYRAYVTDSITGEHVAWFFGTSLDSFSVNFPRYIWNLPWHKTKMKFDVNYDHDLKKYTSYKINSHSKWANLNIELEDTGKPPKTLLGFSDLETGLVLLTHPLKGFFYLRNGKLGSYSIWHDKLNPTEGHISNADISLLQKLGLATKTEPLEIHSVLIQHQTNFTVYLPPVAL
ncbi:DUF2071 domain-containing protein [Lentisphaera profundi]|uniref:DUF2071 domain-containing protein n=1 Tax=Lentisphaera profundi TaxID=1658616 RepID=A0ABY7VRJ7_9BACT|nr:DUF2071 domain-containing protein [Lentisphaera profundi]WDE96828.1 DUF2071 domain-containing protein [Lentisphaera profundi]